MPIRNYYTVRILGPQNTNVSGCHLVPTSWVRWQHEGCPTVLLAFPNEPLEITRNRVELYENPNQNWDLYCAEIIQNTYSYADDDNDNLLDLSVKSSTNRYLEIPRTTDILQQNVNKQYGGATDPLTTSAGSTQRWTLKHQEYAPGIVELMPNTGVYIEEAQLRQHLEDSTKCTQLARLLIKDIFTEAALIKYQYIGRKKCNQRLQLDINAIAVIVEFVLKQGSAMDWRRTTDTSVRAAMRYQLELAKKSIN